MLHGATLRRRIAVVSLTMLVATGLLWSTNTDTVSAYRFSAKHLQTGVITGTSPQNVVESMSDKLGNVYILGYFQNTVDFNTGTGTDSKVSAGSDDVSLTKYNSDGSYAWTKVIGGTDSQMARFMAIDGSNNVYIHGSFINNTDFNPDAGTDIRTHIGSSSSFVTKLNADGSYGWTFIGAQDLSESRAMTVTSGGVVYIGGRYQGTINFNPSGTADNKTSNGLYDLFLTHLNANGSYNSTISMGGANWDAILGLTTGSDDSLYLTGSFSGTLDFNPGAGVDNKVAATASAEYYTKYNSDGSYAWTRTLDINPDNLTMQRIAVDSDGNVYLAGFFYFDINFNPNGTADTYLSPNNNDIIFVTRYNADGSYGWSRVVGAPQGWNYTDGLTVSNGYVIVSGLLSEFYSGYNFDFDSSPTSSDTRYVYGEHAFASIYKTDGTYQTSVMINNDGDETYTYNDGGHAITPDGQLVLAGEYFDTFSPEGTDESFAHVNSSDLFITRYQLENYQHITSLPSGLKATTTDGLTDASDLVNGGLLKNTTATVRLSTSTNVPLADITANMTSDRPWSSVSGASDAAAGKAYVHNLTTQPGAGTSYTLYVPKVSGHTAVFVCPNAQSLDQVTTNCKNGYAKSVAANQISEVTIGGNVYFAVAGLSGTGAISTVSALADTGGSLLMTLAIVAGLTTAASFIRKLSLH